MLWALPDPWDKKSCTDLRPEQTAQNLQEPGLMPLPTRAPLGPASWDKWILHFHVQWFHLNPLQHHGAAGAWWGAAPPSIAPGRMDPGTGFEAHPWLPPFLHQPFPSPLHFQVHLGPQRAEPQESWQGDAEVMLISVCLITALLEAHYLWHCLGR